jgi:hypothetical protein
VSGKKFLDEPLGHEDLIDHRSIYERHRKATSLQISSEQSILLCRYANESRDRALWVAITATLDHPMKKQPSIKLLINEETRIKLYFNERQGIQSWKIKPFL